MDEACFDLRETIMGRSFPGSKSRGDPNTDPPSQNDSEFEMEADLEHIASRISDLIFGRK